MSVPPTAEEISQSFDFTGKTALVTGANTGIGKETARVLALRKAHVIMGCRSVEKGEQARQEILQSIGQDKAHLVEVMELDLSSLVKVREFVDRFEGRSSTALHYLINNAGVMLDKPHKSKEGFEIHFGVNHLAHFLLTLLLLPHLKASQPARVIVVSSDGHFGGSADLDLKDYNLTRWSVHNGEMAYLLSKLYNVLFANELNRRLTGTGVTCNSLHPGLILTDVGRDVTREKYLADVEFISKKFDVPVLQIPQGAATTVYVTGCAEAGVNGGMYFKNCGVAPCSDTAQDPEIAKELWELSENLTLVSYPERPL